jgi:hypothetical protein
MDAQPEAGQEYFDKCSLSCHLQFGFMSLRLSMRHCPIRNTPNKNGAYHFDTLLGKCVVIVMWPLPSSNGGMAGAGPGAMTFS